MSDSLGACAKAMGDGLQACERTLGQDTCSFHPGQQLTSHCRECGTLVCVECVMDPQHRGHIFQKIKECLREPVTRIERYISKIDKVLLSAVEKEFTETQKEKNERIVKHAKTVKDLNDQGTKFKTDIDAQTESMVSEMDTELQNANKLLDKHMDSLASLKKYLTEERKKYVDIIKSGSEILKFDSGSELLSTNKEKEIPKHPIIPSLKHTVCDDADKLIRKALGFLVDMNKSVKDSSKVVTKPTDQLQAPPSDSSKVVTKPTDQLQAPPSDSSKVVTKTTDQAQVPPSADMQLTCFDNTSPHYDSVTPVTKDTAWTRVPIYDESDKTYYCNIKLSLITNTGKVLRHMQTENNNKIVWICIQPRTGTLYGGFGDKTIRNINTTTGKTTTILQCQYMPRLIKVTSDDHVLVGTWQNKESVCKYKPKNTNILKSKQLVSTSTEKYKVWDIDHSPSTGRVVISCNDAGVVVLNSDLTQIHRFTGLPGDSRKKFVCDTAVFDSHSNIVIGDCRNKDIYIVDGEHYNLVRVLHTDSDSNIGRVSLY